MLAYNLSVHKNPKQVSRLMRSIYSSEDLYYLNIFNIFGLHANKKRAEWADHLKPFEKSNVSFMFRSSNAWGTIEQVKTTIAAMEHFRNSEYSYFINLSGQCYPIKSIRSIKETLSNDTRSYMQFYPITNYEHRFAYHYYPIPNWRPTQFLLALVVGRPETNKSIRVPRLNKKLLQSFDLYMGSTWFCLHKDHVEYVLDFIKNNPDYLKFFSTVQIPEEHFFQIILLNSPHKSEIINDSLRYLVWPGPKVLRTEDIDHILNSGKFFARKFDIEIDSDVLDMLDLHNEN